MDTVGHDPDRLHGRAVEVEAASSLWGLFCGAIYYPLFARLDVGRRLARPARQQHGASASATSTSPAPASCTPWVAWPRWPARSCSGPASASSARTASPGPCPATTSRWPCWARSSCCSAGSASTPPPRFAGHRHPVRRGRHQHRHRRCLRRRHRDVLDHDADRQARPRHDGQRHARRPRGHHRPVRLRVSRGPRRSSACIAGVLVIEAVFFIERKFKIDDPVGAIAVHGVNGLFGVLCVGLFANGTYGAGWNAHRAVGDRRHGVTGSASTTFDAAGVRQLSRRPSVRRDHRRRDRRPVLRLLQDPEHAYQGRHPVRRRRTSSPASTCPRWACSPTPSSPERSAAMARATVARWPRRRSAPDMSHGGGRSRVLRPPRPRPGAVGVLPADLDDRDRSCWVRPPGYLPSMRMRARSFPLLVLLSP